MKVLITGGAGYIGTELCYALDGLEQVEEVIVYDNLSRGNYNLFIGKNGLKHTGFRFVEGDILDSRKLKEVVSEADVVFHLAAKVTTPFADHNTHAFEQINHWGTAELVYAVEQSNIKQLYYLSSASVYGSQKEIVNTHSSTNPDTYYGMSKARGEEHVNRLVKKGMASIIRLGNVYGYSKSMRFDAVINKFMFESNFKGRILIKGNGEQKRAFIHISRVVDCLKGFLVHPLDSGVYNLVDVNLSIIDIVDALKSTFPELEMIFVDQHLKLREIQVERDDRLKDRVNFSKDGDLISELENFRKHLTF